MQPVSRVYEAILADEIAYFFCIVIVVWLAMACFVMLIRPISRLRTATKFIAVTPNSLATLGVLGTFIGILIGLLDFDVNRVDSSVPRLLAGLKIAFTTSIVGISAAILFRLCRVLLPSEKMAEIVTPSDIHAILTQIRDDTRDAANNSTEQLTALRMAISADGDGSLLTQVQKLRTSNQDGQNNLISEF